MTSAYSVPCINAVLVAEHELSLNIKEVSNNNSRRIAMYKKGAVNSAPWCASFVSYVYGQGQSASNNKTFGYDASTQSIKRQAIDANCYAKKNTGYTPRVGDLAMWTRNSWQGHIGIVTKVYEDGSFDVIEGNSSNNKVEKIHYKSQNDVGKYFDGFVKMNEWTSGSKVTYKA
jgi:surface antigen